ncbi:DNA (Cytosine-5)-methyltransferase DRM1/2 isoform 4 [Hibiscus syriacus]|uniref:DNA (Cytosine-5)-methyltransferase DRM1/2 isoform 4 n=1 Tax=Hibiscus syriacus TaxID=106335 RepID=A0A6A2ZGX8_HIBSY|nr:DNA (Cytosine-5)-methyltransferase DRM1/2 isoform 4 [Hibiscus syriacus]
MNILSSFSLEVIGRPPAGGQVLASIAVASDGFPLPRGSSDDRVVFWPLMVVGCSSLSLFCSILFAFCRRVLLGSLFAGNNVDGQSCGSRASGVFVRGVVVVVERLQRQDKTPGKGLMDDTKVLKTSCTEGLTDDPKVLKTSCTEGLTDDPKVLKTLCTEGLTDDPKVLKTSHTDSLTDDPKVLKTSCTEGLTDDPKVLKTSCTEGLTDDLKVLKTSCTEGLTDDPKVLKTSCTEGLTDDPKVLKTSCIEGLTDDPKVLKTSCTEWLTDDLKVLKTSCTEGLTDDPKFLKTSCTEGLIDVGNSLLIIDSSSNTEEILDSNSDEENKLLYLTKTGYSEAEGSIAMERCGMDSSISELIDFICDAQMAKAADALLPKRKKQRKLEKKLLNEDDHAVHLSNLMIGFGIPTEPDQITQRTLPEDVIGPPYFYYENVALAPVGVWNEISMFLMSAKNGIWYGSLEPDEVEILLGFPKNHTRRGSSRDMFPGGINVLSLFYGIGGAEVVLYRLSIPLKVNVQELNGDQLEQLMSRFFEFNLVVGGITCNNLTGRNKHHQDELEDFCCNLLKDIMDIILTRKMIDMEEVAMMYQDLSQYHGITRVQVRYGLMAGENNMSGDAYRPQHEISDNLS